MRRPRQSLTNQLENFDITEDDDPLLRVPDNDGSDEDPEYKEETASEVDDDEIFHENQKVSGESEDDEISAVASVSDQGGDDGAFRIPGSQGPAGKHADKAIQRVSQRRRAARPRQCRLAKLACFALSTRTCVMISLYSANLVQTASL